MVINLGLIVPIIFNNYKNSFHFSATFNWLEQVKPSY